jgi:hypothetical protein
MDFYVFIIFVTNGCEIFLKRIFEGKRRVEGLKTLNLNFGGKILLNYFELIIA